jgi:hypothetical protein
VIRALLYKLNPAVPKQWLVLFAGILWTLVGGFLCIRAVGWIEFLHGSSASIPLASGLAIAFAGNRLMFSNIARKNLFRISQLPQRACVFAFTGWRGYILITAMSALGIVLRNSTVPRVYLAALYTAMGGALILASTVSYRGFWEARSPDTDTH